jgi:hypothetical protein
LEPHVEAVKIAIQEGKRRLAKSERDAISITPDNLLQALGDD